MRYADRVIKESPGYREGEGKCQRVGKERFSEKSLEMERGLSSFREESRTLQCQCVLSTYHLVPEHFIPCLAVVPKPADWH